MRKARILLADDHRMFLAGIEKLLAAEFEIVGAVESGRAVLEQAPLLKPDVVVIDVSMPLLNGIDTVRQLRALIPDMHVVFLSMHGDPMFVQDAIDAGADAYVLKREAPEDLITAIRMAVRGESYFPHLGCHDGGGLPEYGHDGQRPRIGLLTERQREVLQLVAEGRQLKEIAWILGVSTKTVEFHKYRLMKLLGVQSNSELTAFAIRHGLRAD
ncbi:MAG: response regulator transcription factor [Bryobacterales bacterium]|nr:response regulator transcription factor [Bryobacterales bacterium]